MLFDNYFKCKCTNFSNKKSEWKMDEKTRIISMLPKRDLL